MSRGGHMERFFGVGHEVLGVAAIFAGVLAVGSVLKGLFGSKEKKQSQ